MNDYSKNESSYQTVRKNVESLKLIQIGITLSDIDGNIPDDVSTWQFNLQFDKQYFFNNEVRTYHLWKAFTFWKEQGLTSTF